MPLLSQRWLRFASLCLAGLFAVSCSTNEARPSTNATAYVSKSPVTETTPSAGDLAPPTRSIPVNGDAELKLLWSNEFVPPDTDAHPGPTLAAQRATALFLLPPRSNEDTSRRRQQLDALVTNPDTFPRFYRDYPNASGKITILWGPTRATVNDTWQTVGCLDRSQVKDGGPNSRGSGFVFMVTTHRSGKFIKVNSIRARFDFGGTPGVPELIDAC